jgi:hypothetical protein
MFSTIFISHIDDLLSLYLDERRGGAGELSKYMKSCNWKKNYV